MLMILVFAFVFVLIAIAIDDGNEQEERRKPTHISVDMGTKHDTPTTRDDVLP